MHLIVNLSKQYPQLLIPITENAHKTVLYRDAVMRGQQVCKEPDFIGSPEDSYTVEKTPVGNIGILCLGNRQDFEHALCALAYRCEPRAIPASVGANYIGGLPNWEKIRKHKQDYLESGGNDWAGEFRRFTADKSNYTDSLILLSTGYYSNIQPEEIGLSPEDWKTKSLEIRKHHELTHFIYRKSYPGDVDVIRDEVLADYIGIKKAFGTYIPRYARMFLGIEYDIIPVGARIRHYVDEENTEAAACRAKIWIAALAKLPKNRNKEC